MRGDEQLTAVTEMHQQLVGGKGFPAGRHCSTSPLQCLAPKLGAPNTLLCIRTAHNLCSYPLWDLSANCYWLREQFANATGDSWEYFASQL